MKKIFFVIAFFVSLIAGAQVPLGYTGLNHQYQYPAMKIDSGLHVPAYNGVPTGSRVKVWGGSGNVGVDTLNGDFYIKSGGSWRKVGGATGPFSTVSPYTIYGNRTGLTTAPAFFTNPFIDSAKISNDSVYGRINGTWVFQFISTGGGGSGNPNSNIGSGFRLAVPFTNDIKTIFGGLWMNLDSSSNTDGITFKVDSAGLFTASGGAIRRKDSLTASNPLGYVTKTILGDTASAIRSAIQQTGLYNPLDPDSLLFPIDADNIWVKAVKASGVDPVQVNTTRTDSTIIHAINIRQSLLDSIRNGDFGGGVSSPAGNYGNVQLNRNGAFATPASDSLTYNGGEFRINLADQGAYVLQVGGDVMIKDSYPTIRMDADPGTYASIQMDDAAGNNNLIYADAGMVYTVPGAAYSHRFIVNGQTGLTISNTSGTALTGAISTSTSQISSSFLGTAGSDKGAFHLERTFTGGATGPAQHGFVDKTSFHPWAAAFNSFGTFTHIGSNGSNQDHDAGFQNTQYKDSSNTLSRMYGFVNAIGGVTGGIVNDWFGYYHFDQDTSGGGHITRQTAIYVPALVKADTSIAIAAYTKSIFGLPYSSADSMINVTSLKATEGVRFTTLPDFADTTNYKPVVVNSSGTLYKATYWPGGGGTTSPAGSDREVQFNNAGSFGASSNFKYNSSGEMLVGMADGGAYKGQFGGDVLMASAYPILYMDATAGTYGSLRMEDAAGAVNQIYADAGLTYSVPSGSYFHTFLVNSASVLQLSNTGTPTAGVPGRLAISGTQSAGASQGIVQVGRTVSSVGANHRGFRDGTIFQQDAVAQYAYAAFDANVTMRVLNTRTADHLALVQARGVKDSTGTLTTWYDFVAAQGVVSEGTVTNKYGLYIFPVDTTGTGVVTNQIGIYIPDLTQSTNKVGAIIVNDVRIGSTSTPTVALDVVGDIKASAAGTTSTSVVTNAATQTISNKRWVARVGSTTSSATPTINTDNYDVYKLTAQAANITSFTTNLSGTPNDGDILEIQITDDGTPRTISWGASFVASSVALPTTTTASTTLVTIFQYFTNSSYGNNKWVMANTY